MATPMTETFGVWLTEKLTSVSSDIDTDVFVSFIIGILDTEDDNDEKLESITGLLEGVMEPDQATEVSKNILDEWMAASEKTKGDEATNDIGDKLSKIMEEHTVATVKERQLTAEEKKRKEVILKQYAEVSGEEDTDDEFGDESAETTEKQESSDGLMTKNVNKQAVERSMREAREKSKQENETKKEKNKQDRQAQKQKADERKQTEKKRTQKGERRR